MSPMESSEMESPSADHTTRCYRDQMIRKCGYTIKSRPNRGEAVWERDGITYTQSAVLQREGLRSRY